MKKVILDQETIAKLLNVREELELFSERGLRLGVLKPDPAHAQSQLANIEPPFTEEQLAKIEAGIGKTRGFTTAEVLAHLRSLEQT